MWRPCFIPFPHHHHHHHHHHHNHGHHCQLFHRHVCPNFPATNPEQLFSSTTLPNDVVNVPEDSEHYPDSTPPLLIEEKESEEGIIDEEEYEDEPIFVLTDEWRDLFAKSEAKRKLEKKLAKKGKKEALKLSDEGLKK